jgi:hypothetical protein
VLTSHACRSPLRGLGAAFCLLATVAAARAQQQAPTEETPPAWLVWRPSLALTGAGYDSNVLNEEAVPRGDFFAAAAAGLAPIWHPGIFTLSADTTLSYTYFRRFVQERGVDATVAGHVEAPVAMARLHADGAYMNVRQRLNFEVDQRARRSQADVRAGIDVPAGGHTTASVEVHRTELTFADQNSSSFELRQTLNRTERGGSAALEFAATPLTTIAMTGDLTSHRFELAPDRDGQRASVGAGVIFAPDALIAGRASVSWQRVTVENAAIQAFRGTAASVDLSTRIGSATRIGAGGGRDVVFSSDAVSPYYVQNGARVSLTQGLGDRWDIGVRAERATLDYARDKSTSLLLRDSERVSSVRGSLGYHFAGGLRVSVDVEEMHRTADPDAHRSYGTRRIITSLSKPLGF